jgi:hypothetical protein
LVDGLVQLSADGQPVGLAGTLSVHGSVELEGRTLRFDDAFGRGFHLISVGDDPLQRLTGEQRAFLDRLGVSNIRMSKDGAAGTCRDVSGKYHRFLQEAGLQAVLVRPDFYIYGGVADSSQVPALVDDLRRGLNLVEGTGSHSSLAVHSMAGGF